MTESAEKRVPGQVVLGSGPQWTFLGTTQDEAMLAVSAARIAAGALTAWSASCMARASQVSISESRLVEAEPIAAKKKAREINGVSKAVSPEYAVMFGKIAADFISVDEGLAAAEATRQKSK